MPNDEKDLTILGAAKQALAKANNFTRSAEGKSPSQFAPKADPKPASAKPASSGSGQSGISKDVSDVASGLKWRAEQSKAVAPTLGSFKEGGIVPKTGKYLLHKDEKVIPAEKAKMDSKMMDAASQALGKASPSKPTMKAKLHMRITPTDNGAFIMDHEHRGGSEMEKGTSKPPEQHVAMDVKSLLKHVGDHYGAKASDWEQERGDAPASPKGKEVEAAGAKKADKTPDKDDKKD